jgi:hypothetical protein
MAGMILQSIAILRGHLRTDKYQTENVVLAG